jgi:outer membrane protein assembly factor BamB
LRRSIILIIIVISCAVAPSMGHGAGTPGTLKWSYATGQLILSSPAIGTDGTIYVGSGDSKLYAINPDGTLKWSYSTRGAVDSSPAIGTDGTIYVGSGDSMLYAINPDGMLKWSYDEAGGGIFTSPAIGTDGTIYFGAYDGKLYAISSNGKPKWSCCETGDIIYWSSPAIGVDGTIYVGSGDSMLYAISSNGKPKWSYATGDRVFSSPAIGTDRTIYVGSGDRNLYAINPDGTLKWSYSTGGAVDSSPAIGTDGTIYFGSWDYKLYSTYSTSLGLATSPWPMFHHDLKHRGRFVAPSTFTTLRVAKSGTGTGTVTSNPSGIYCGTTCSSQSAEFNPGVFVTLIAPPDLGSVFAGWSGPCAGTGACSVTMTGDLTVIASFNKSTAGTIIVSPASLNFGTVKKDVLSSPKRVTIKNTGKKGSSLVIGDLSITGANGLEFAQTSTCGAPLESKETCEVLVTLTSTSYGRKAGTLTIPNDSTKKPSIEVKLAGNAGAPKLSVSPLSLNFGTVSISQGKFPKKRITIKNTGVSDLTINSITLTGDAAFSQTNTCITIPQKGSCIVEVTFTPTAIGAAQSSQIDILSNAPVKGMGTVKLSGEGKQ